MNEIDPAHRFSADAVRKFDGPTEGDVPGSMNDVAREGLRLVTTEAARDERVRGLARRVVSEHAGLLKRLGEA